MADSIEGFYSAYMTGADGSGFTMFVFARGRVVGCDPLGVRFDGTYAAADDGYVADVHVTVPAAGTVIQGVSAGPTGLTYDVTVKLPQGFEERDFVRIDTPLGPVNARFRKLRDVGSLA